jgi:hypothetical protein
MEVVRKEKLVLEAHQLPASLDAQTKDFAYKHQLAISQLPDGRFSVFNLRWSIASAHVVGHPQDFVVLDDGVAILSPELFAKRYAPYAMEAL